METSVITNKINLIGKELVKCPGHCNKNGVVNDPDNFIIPRCLYFEDRDLSSTGCVIVGLNPGKSTKKEQDYYRKNGINYDAVVNFYLKKSYNHPYYKRLRSLVDQIGHRGPILWSELVKCESDRNSLPPLQTFRICQAKFLSKELKIIPQEWPLIAVGKEAYKALSYLYTNRSVLGVPHPTSSRGYFAKLFNNGLLEKSVLNEINGFKKNPQSVLWLKYKG